MAEFSNSAVENNTEATVGQAINNRPQLEGREITDSPYKLIGRCFAAGKWKKLNNLKIQTPTQIYFYT